MTNSAKRTIAIKFAHDPDVAIEDMTGGRARPIVSIEIKGGTDISNIHNRIGEAEKSHQKGRARGFFQFWTILGAQVDAETAKRESPTTTKFYYLGDLEKAGSPGAKGFAEDVASQVGIPAHHAAASPRNVPRSSSGAHARLAWRREPHG